MDYGTYAVSCVRAVFAAEPTLVRAATYRPMPNGYDQKCDEAFYAEYEFPNGGVAKITTDLQARGGWWFPSLTANWPRPVDPVPTLRLTLRAKDDGLEGDFQKRSQKTIFFYGYMGPHLYHRIDITTTTELRNPQDGKVVKTNASTERKKVYKWPPGSDRRTGEEFWSTYRYQLEEFVNRVKKRPGSGVWIEPENSMRQMEMIDATYLKAGLPTRPTSKALER
ncbi:hypothetical protein, variant 5 [Verruconis gallopava]|nr:hypothetical protein, variant 2 [Verruconis gallopava]XP_016208592.1 hypothetical protein, variant 3 [Verruconis gallopava]XP_016208593.1 hypothetical protein, variant 4 [Verruconis gallopava]XP_016208594.1 hypothetical protein, variant 5 [Verruconis gallopava]KIV98721.1 hypothetical protein, variant 2 [Verruconis gallopava]KIV98722.1 hypothetical protein, variant 3 [Verruconis gallopava]KIV98723.1 hypothetical protein, variant 4 [Verruconis gallopava]KIV98724.1 hypothetical protein, vari